MKIRQESIKTQLNITNKPMSPHPGILGLEVQVQFQDTLLATTQSKPETSWGPYDKGKPVFPNCVHITTLQCLVWKEI